VYHYLRAAIFPVLSPSRPGRGEDERTLGTAILGSTGSIGEQTLQVAERERVTVRVVALATSPR
jgi:hypothetical protein